jgi:general secretion pathway protein F
MAMTTFRYQAYGLNGEFAEGDIEAGSADLASELLWAQGVAPFKIDAIGQSSTKWWKREIFSSSKIKRKDLVSFTRQFVTLSAAEIPLDDTLRILSDQATSPAVRSLVQALLSDVQNGATLSEAMQRQPGVFATDYISIVKAGELGGKVSEVFSELADLLERRMEVLGRIQSALVYPCILIVLSLVALSVIIGALVPSIAPMLADSGKPVPLAIQFLLLVQSRWMEILAGGAIAAIGAALATSIILRRHGSREALDRFVLKLPVVGPFLVHQETARFARTLGTMLQAGVPLLQAANAAKAVVSNRHLAGTMETAIESIGQGVALNRALRNETDLPDIALRMISVGEESGKLDRMLTRVAIMFEQQTQRGIERFISMLTPMLTAAIAMLVGALILPIMSSVLSINDMAFR